MTAAWWWIDKPRQLFPVPRMFTRRPARRSADRPRLPALPSAADNGPLRPSISGKATRRFFVSPPSTGELEAECLAMASRIADGRGSTGCEGAPQCGPGHDMLGEIGSGEPRTLLDHSPSPSGSGIHIPGREWGASPLFRTFGDPLDSRLKSFRISARPLDALIGSTCYHESLDLPEVLWPSRCDKKILRRSAP